MIKKTIAILHPAYLSLRNSQLVLRDPCNCLVAADDVEAERSQERTIPIEDIGVLLLDHKQITITQGLMAALIENNCAIITCNDKSMPVGLNLPLESNTIQSERFRNQMDSSLPLRKQLWQQTVVAKISNQAIVLKKKSRVENKMLLNWAKKVKSGDSENLEGRAAAYYWKNIFSGIAGLEYFVRGRDEAPPNNLLNYGYAILRAVTARALVGSGLLPTIGINHHNRYNAYCLADDIMEPYRPYIDELVYDLISDRGVENLQIDNEIKSKLLSIPVLDVRLDGQRSPLMVAMSQTTASLAKCFAGRSRKIIYPDII